jgi:hypothetical protein
MLKGHRFSACEEGIEGKLKSDESTPIYRDAHGELI